MNATLYSLSLSHPAKAAKLMLDHKGVETRVVDLVPGIHPLLLRAHGFRGGTVPALRLEDGARLQGSRRIARALDELVPDPPLFPGDPARRRDVETAERWGEQELQGVPRRMFRWGARNVRDIRLWMAREVVGMPLPNLMATVNVPVAEVMARIADATDERVRTTLRELPGMLDRVDELIAAGVIAGAQRNAADFQILTTVRKLTTFEDLRAAVAGRPCEPAARAIWPDDAFEPVPAFLPREWLEPVLA